MPVLVTGAAGFVGRHLVNRLLALGARVVCMVADLDHAVGAWQVPPSADFPQVVAADIADARALRAIVAATSPRRVFHLAASIDRDPDLTALPHYMHVNAEGTAAVLSACASLGLASQVESIMTMGSATEYGPDAPCPLHEGLPLNPVTPYGISKAAATMACLATARAYGLPVTVLRPLLLYGPGQSERFFIGQLVRAAATRRPLDMTAGEQTRDFLHVSDAVEGILLASGSAALRGQVANLCSGEEYALQEIVTLWQNLVGVNGLVRLGTLPYRQGEIFRCVGDAGRLRAATGWEPRVALRDGLRMLAETLPAS